MQTVSSNPGPKVKRTVTKADIKVHTITQFKKEAVWPNAGSEMVLEQIRHNHPITAR